MSEDEYLDTILTLGATLAEETLLRAGEKGVDELHLLASALAWASLRRFWNGEPAAVLRRWSTDVPEAMGHYNERVTPRP